ncbi:hypothetical protein SBRCBS47491_007173 [Sporothrix bragantina]|uniref:F-box domain-containing protein n=1 Tax=Sporothrix bragantina TaxID=671064 RepID=A0ABP0CB19_9PEZI
MADTSPSTAAGPAVDGYLTHIPQQPQTIVEEQHLQDLQQEDAPITDIAPKRRTRQRLLRGLSRISSSSSLASTGRARSSSTPFPKSGVNVSCMSLGNGSSPLVQSPSNGSISALAFSPVASPSIPGTPKEALPPTSSSSMQPFPPFPHSQSSNVVRKANQSNIDICSSVSRPQDMTRALSMPLPSPRPKKTFTQLWNSLPHEVQIHTLRQLKPKEVIRVSRVNKKFHKLCFDGQLWTTFDASEFYQDIPVDALAKIIVSAGPFVKDLNLRGCIQIEKYQDALLMASACNNLVNATLEGAFFDSENVEELLRRNQKLAHINLTGLTCVSNETCLTLAEHCTQLEVLNLSWCKSATAKGVQTVLKSCAKLRDLRVGEIRGFDSLSVAKTFFDTNRLERLVMSGCSDLTDSSFQAMLHGIDPPIDLLTDRPIVPPRRLRHLDLSRCTRLTDRGVAALGYCVPDLEGLVLGGCPTLTDQALEPIFASTPKLSHLDLEDLVELKNVLFSNHLAKSECIRTLKHLSISYCEDVGDTGMVPVFRACTNLRSVEMDNTRVSDLSLAEAAAMVRARTSRAATRADRPYIGLSLAVYDCPNITQTGVREIMSRNAEILTPPQPADGAAPVSLRPYPTEIISLKCFYGWQMTVDEHTKRIMRGHFAAAHRLQRKWADSIQATEEANAGGSHGRRRRRRAREARQAHADEEAAGGIAGAAGQGMGIGRRRARTATCAIM